jgi:hypothetical protein
MSHPDDSGDSALQRAARSLRRRRTTPSASDEGTAPKPAPTPETDPAESSDATESDATESTEATADPVDDATESTDDTIADHDDGDAAADDAAAEAPDTEASADEEPEPEATEDEPTEPEPEASADEPTEPEPEATEDEATEDEATEDEATEPEKPDAETDETPEPEATPEPEPEAEPEPEPEPTLAEPERIGPAAEAEKAVPKYIPPVTAGTGPASDGRQKRRRLLLWASSVAAIVVAVVVVVVAVLATRGSPAVPQADQAAGVAQKYATALSQGDLTTLRDITCGDRKQFFDSTDPQAFAAQYQAQKDAGRLVEVRAVKASRAVDPTNAIVEVSAALTGSPDKVSDVVLRLESQGGTWKVCSSAAGSQPTG